MLWRVKAQCNNCPFRSSGAGLRMRKLLRPGRWEEILRSLAREEAFHCHKTTHGQARKRLVCAGALAWQTKMLGRKPLIELVAMILEVRSIKGTVRK